MYAFGLSATVCSSPAPIHKMAVVKECKQKPINELGYREQLLEDWTLETVSFVLGLLFQG